jgi:outer membrane protein insertion porin family
MKGKWLWGLGLAAALSLTLIAAPRPVAAQRPGPGGLVETKAPIVVAVLPFRVNGPAEVAYLGQAIPDVLTTRLVTLTPAEQGAVAAAIQRRGGAPLTEAVAREVGREAGAQFVVVGSLTAIGDRLSLDARILPVTSGRVATVYIQGDGLGDLLTHIGSLALEIDKGISGVAAFYGSDPEPAPPGLAPRGTPSGGIPTLPVYPARPNRGRAF